MGIASVSSQGKIRQAFVASSGKNDGVLFPSDRPLSARAGGVVESALQADFRRRGSGHLYEMNSHDGADLSRKGLESPTYFFLFAAALALVACCAVIRLFFLSITALVFVCFWPAFF